MTRQSPLMMPRRVTDSGNSARLTASKKTTELEYPCADVETAVVLW